MMKIKAIGKIILKWIQGALEILAFFPIIFTLGISIISEEIWVWILSLLLFHLIGLVLGRVLLRRPRYVYLGIGLLVSLLIAWVTPYHMYTRLLIIPSGFFMFIRGTHLRARRWGRVFPVSYLWIGIVLYLLSGTIYSLAPTLKPYFSPLAWAGLSYVFIALFIINSEKLRDASLPGNEASPTLPSIIIRNNRVLILLTMALVLVISFFDRLREVAARYFKAFLGLVGRVILFLTNLLYGPDQGGDGGPGQGAMNMLPIEESEPSWLLKVLEKVAMAMALIVLAVLLWYGLRIVLRQLKRLYRYLSRILRDRLVHHEDTGFIDEREILIDFADVGREYMDRFQNWIQALMEREPKWEELSNNRERIRFLYRNMIFKSIKGGYRYKRHLTPRETGRDILRWSGEEELLMEDLTASYDRVRYGSAEDIGDKKIGELAIYLREKTYHPKKS